LATYAANPPRAARSESDERLPTPLARRVVKDWSFRTTHWFVPQIVIGLERVFGRFLVALRWHSGGKTPVVDTAHDFRVGSYNGLGSPTALLAGARRVPIPSPRRAPTPAPTPVVNDVARRVGRREPRDVDVGLDYGAVGDHDLLGRSVFGEHALEVRERALVKVALYRPTEPPLEALGELLSGPATSGGERSKFGERNS